MNPSPPDLFPQRPVRSEDERAPSYRARRIVTILVCLLLIAGVAYRFWPSHSAPSGEIPTIKAENNTYKQKPEQPGGIDIPHQDVQVYEALDGKDAEKPQVEHLLPPPETPQSNVPPTAAGNAVSPSVTQTENLAPPKAATEAPPSLEPSSPPPVQTTVESRPAPATAPVPVKATPTPAPAPAPVTASAKSKAAPAETASVKGGKVGRAIQLASVQDEKSAHDMMEKLQSHYASILGDTRLRLVKADLGAKGIFYRIRSQPLTEDQANKICDAVKRMKAGCILVR